MSYHQLQHYTHETVAAPVVDLTQDSLSNEAYGYGSEPYPAVASSNTDLFENTSGPSFLEGVSYSSTPYYPGPGYGVASSSLSTTPYSSTPLSVAQVHISPQSTPSQNRITTTDPFTKTEASDPRKFSELLYESTS